MSGTNGGLTRMFGVQDWNPLSWFAPSPPSFIADRCVHAHSMVVVGQSCPAANALIQQFTLPPSVALACCFAAWHDSVQPQALKACHAAVVDSYPEGQPAATAAAPAVLAPKQPKPVQERFPAAALQAPASASPAVPRAAEVKVPRAAEPKAEASVHHSTAVPTGAEAAKVHLKRMQDFNLYRH